MAFPICRFNEKSCVILASGNLHWLKEASMCHVHVKKANPLSHMQVRLKRKNKLYFFLKFSQFVYMPHGLMPHSEDSQMCLEWNSPPFFSYRMNTLDTVLSYYFGMITYYFPICVVFIHHTCTIFIYLDNSQASCPCKLCTTKAGMQLIGIW